MLRPYRRRTFGTPPGMQFSNIFVSKPCRGAGARTGAQRGAQSRPKDGQSDPNGPQRVAFGRPGGHFWREIRDSGPLQEPQYLLCFNHIMRVRAGPFSLLNAPWGRSTPAEPSFLDFLRPLGRKGGAQGGPGCPKDVQTATRGHPKITKKSPSGPQGVPGCPGRSRGYPPRRKNYQKRLKIVSFAARCSPKIRGSAALSAVPCHDDFRLASSAWRRGRP